MAGEFGPGSSGSHLAGLVLLVLAVTAWLAWTRARTAPVPAAVTPVALAALAVTGGALAALAPVAMAFPAIATMGITAARPLRKPAVMAVPGAAAMVVAVAAASSPIGVALGGLAAILAGAMIGVTRRETQMHTLQAFSMDMARAELLAGRNHLARGLHDVLAHSLSALSLQLEALDSMLAAAPERTPGWSPRWNRSNASCSTGSKRPGARSAPSARICRPWNGDWPTWPPSGAPP